LEDLSVSYVSPSCYIAFSFRRSSSCSFLSNEASLRPPAALAAQLKRLLSQLIAYFLCWASSSVLQK